MFFGEMAANLGGTTWGSKRTHNRMDPKTMNAIPPTNHRDTPACIQLGACNPLPCLIHMTLSSQEEVDLVDCLCSSSSATFWAAHTADGVSPVGPGHIHKSAPPTQRRGEIGVGPYLHKSAKHTSKEVGRRQTNNKQKCKGVAATRVRQLVKTTNTGQQIVYGLGSVPRLHRLLIRGQALVEIHN